MGITERREREKEAIRDRIVEAARDIVSDQGLDALSMRSIAERIEYSPATIYLHFRDKEELLCTVVEEGFARLQAAMKEELAEVGPEASAVERYHATGRGYVRFALENTAYMRVMFELPAAAQPDCGCEPAEAGAVVTGEKSFACAVDLVQRAMDEGSFRTADALRRALVGWGLVHGLTSLYLAGHMAGAIRTHEELKELVEEAMRSMGEGWQVDPEPAGAQPAG